MVKVDIVRKSENNGVNIKLLREVTLMKKYQKPEFHFHGSVVDVMYGHSGVNKEWDNLGRVKPLAGSMS